MNYELIRDAVRIALCACFGLQPDSDEALAFIRRSYEEPEVIPQPARTTDVIYWDVSTDYGSDPVSYGSAVSQAAGSGFPSVERFLPCQLVVVCYGPSCAAHAEQIRSLIYVDGANQPRSILRKAGIYPVPDPAPVELLYEPEGSLWRRRADVRIPFRTVCSVTSPAAVRTIQTAPVIIVRH